MRQLMKRAAVAVCSAMVVCVTAPAHAVTVFTTPSTFDGWLITPSAGISLTADTTSSSNLALTKAATFSTMAEGLIITFTQVSTSAAPTITFNSEALTNNSGSSWGGFEFLIMNPLSSATFVDSSTSPFQPGTGYTSGSFGSTNVVYAGTQADKATSDWGLVNASGDQGTLMIAADPTGIGTTFDLKEIPLTASEVPVQSAGGIPIPIGSVVAVPVPEAAWQGGLALLAMGLIRIGQNLRRKPAAA